MNTIEMISNHRILIIDDNPSIHADFQKILCPNQSRSLKLRGIESTLFDEPARPAGSSFGLDSAYQGKEALDMVKSAVAQNRPYALAFVDVRMPPGWDGLETIARIWEVDPSLQVVVCTAYSDYSWEQMRAKVGQSDNMVILKKPFDNVEVQQLAHALTKKWSLNFQAGLKLAELEVMAAQRTTQLAELNKSLAVSEERFSKAFHESPLPSAIQNMSDRRFVDVNQRLAQIAGWTRNQMIGRTPEELNLWEKPELVEQWIDAISRQERVRDLEANIRTASGALHEVLVSLTPIVVGNTSHLLLLAQDVAERVVLERKLRQAQKMEAVGQLAAGVAHDFNNVLTVIQGHADLVHQGITMGIARPESVEQISQAAERAASLIRQLLMFSRKQVMQFQYLDLNETMAQAIRMIQRLVGEHVQLAFHPHKPLPAIHADQSMIEQIVMNLAVNARDAMPNGGQIAIATSLKTLHRGPTEWDLESRDGDFVCLSFSDTGIGMDANTLNRIFEPFFTTKPVGQGTGLGLSTVFGIVRQHSGWIEVSSAPNQGACFHVCFAASENEAVKTVAKPELVVRHGRETILVAEDEDPLRKLISRVLRSQGYTVLDAASGAEALEVWRKANVPVDLLLTDVVMPGGVMGFQLAETISKQCPHLKVIYSSGYTPDMAGQKISLTEGRNFLPKPYSITKLAQLVRNCLDGKQG
jgi:two-component system cell cycle sensor histidine kinase/response regulator CckA